MITAGDFKKGITVEWDGGVWTIVDFQHVKPGKGAAFVRTKIKNVMTGAVVERSFNPTDKMPKAIIETKEMQYVYNDGELYYFMDVETYDQIPMSLDKVEGRQRRMEREAKERKRLAELYADCDDRFAFIVGYTDSGAPYGVMWEEVGIDMGLPFEEKVKLYHMQMLG